jgi:hypothetical protein
MDVAFFTDLHESNFKVASGHIVRDGNLAGALLLYDAYGRMGRVMQGPETATPAESERLFAETGMWMIAGNWRDNLPTLKMLVDSGAVVAASLIGEVWLAAGKTAQEVMAMNISTHEHPLKDEAIAVVSLWPSQNVQLSAVNLIRREKVGPGITLEPAPAAFETVGASVSSWLIDLLPH